MVALLGVKHNDDDLRAACAQVHSAAHAGNLLAWNDPVSQVSVFRNFHSAQYGSLYVAASYQAEAGSGVEELNVRRCV